MHISLDDVLKPGQKVQIERNVTFVYELDIEEYLDQMGETSITVEDLMSDIQDNVDVEDFLDEYDEKVSIDRDTVFVLKITNK